MAVTVLVPLHSDRTTLDVRAILTEDLEAAVEALSGALGRQLGAVGGEWPELRQLYVDCVLVDATALSAQPARFDKKLGQFNIGCSVDCRSLLAADPQRVAREIFDVVCQAADGGFAKRKQPGLAAACTAFRAGMDEAFVRDCIAKAPPREVDEPVEFDPIPLDAEGRRRHMRDLRKGPGELWLMAGPRAGTIDVEQTMAAIEAFVEDGQLGESSGSSVGQGSFDLSFEVDRLAMAGRALDTFLRKHWPDLDFVISDDFEPGFDELGHG